MPTTMEVVLRVAFRPLDEARREGLEVCFGRSFELVCDETTSFLDVDAIVAAASRLGASAVVVEPLNAATASALAARLGPTVELWKQTFVEGRSASRPWERLSVFSGYERVR